MNKNKNNNNGQRMEGFSMRDCLSQDVINKLYSISKKGSKSGDKNQNKPVKR